MTLPSTSMIQTTIVKSEPAIVYHQLSGSMDEKEASMGAGEARSLLKPIVQNGQRFHLMIDTRGYFFNDLGAHRTWSLEFKEQPVLRRHVLKVALIGDDTSQFRAEKEGMESDHVRFFTDAAAARQWLEEA